VLKEALRPHVLNNFTAYLKCEDRRRPCGASASSAFFAPSATAPLGVENINRLVEEILVDARAD